MKIAATCDDDDIGDVVARLLAAGYEEHDKPLQRFKRRGEAITLRKLFTDRGEELQNHVQLVRRADGTCEIFAHVEPAMKWTLEHAAKHCASALSGGADYERGAELLREALRDVADAFGDNEPEHQEKAS